MKYIIDIDDEYTKDWVNETPMCKELCMPISVPNRQRTYHVSTGFKLEPYTEPDRKAIENAQEEAWEFAKQISIMNREDKYELWGTSKYNTINLGYSYAEAKAKYEAWKNRNIRVGDEVIYNSRTKAVVLIPETKEKYGTILTDGFATIVVSHDDLEKTGRHFEDVAELLNKIKENK